MSAMVMVMMLATGAIDLQRQELEVDLSSGSDRFVVHATVDFTAEGGESSVTLVAPSLSISAAQLDGQPVSPVISGASLQLTPSAALSAGAHQLKLSYGGVPGCVVPGRRVCLRANDFTVLTRNVEAFRWYVTAQGAEDRFTGRLLVRAQGQSKVATSPSAVATVTPLGDGTSTWRFDWVVPTEQLGRVQGAFDVVPSDDGRVTGFVRQPSTRPVMERLVRDTQLALPVLEGLYGRPPIEGVTLAFVPPDFALEGAGQLGLIFASEALGTGASQAPESHFARELAHSWWGGWVVPSSPFLGPALAEYSLWRAVEQTQSSEAASAGRRASASWYLYGRGSASDVAILDPAAPTSPVFTHVAAHKGAQVVGTLELLVGQETFTRALQGLTRATARVDDAEFFAAVAKEAKLDLTGWRKQWLEQPGFPTLLVQPSRTEHQLSLDVELPQDFELKVPLVVTIDGGGREVRELLLKKGMNHFEAKFQGPVLRAELDPEWRTLREIIPRQRGDVTLDGEIDGADLLEVAWRVGGGMPAARFRDGQYDALFDIDGDRQHTLSDVHVLLVQSLQ